MTAKSRSRTRSSLAEFSATHTPSRTLIGSGRRFGVGAAGSTAFAVRSTAENRRKKRYSCRLNATCTTRSTSWKSSNSSASLSLWVCLFWTTTSESLWSLWSSTLCWRALRWKERNHLCSNLFKASVPILKITTMNKKLRLMRNCLSTGLCSTKLTSFCTKASWMTMSCLIREHPNKSLTNNPPHFQKTRKRNAWSCTLMNISTQLKTLTLSCRNLIWKTPLRNNALWLAWILRATVYWVAPIAPFKKICERSPRTTNQSSYFQQKNGPSCNAATSRSLLNTTTKRSM